MRTPQTPELVATRNKVDELLKLVPNKRYPDCTPSEKACFDEFKAALENHRAAVRRARSGAANATCNLRGEPPLHCDRPRTEG